MKNSLVKVGLGVLTASILFTGCAVDEFARKYSPENVQQMAMKALDGKSAEKFKEDFRDKHLGSKFAEFYDKEGYSFDYSSNSIQLKKQLVYFSQNIYMKDAYNYVQNKAPSNNITKLYKDTVIERGNTYKVYTGKFNKEVIKVALGSSNLPDYNSSKKRYVKWDLIPLVAEYDKDNNLKSIMLTNVEVGAAYDQVRNPNVQSEIEMTALIYVDTALNPIKNNISVKNWEDNLISEHTK